MSYTIRKPDGTILLSLATNAVDKSATSLSLIGKDVSPYGEYYNNNLIQLLASSANSFAPRSPLTGQLWYNTVDKKLKVYDGTFKSIGGAIIAGTEPTDLIAGDLWFDTSNKQLHVYSNNTAWTIGPAYPASAGATGWVLPDVTIKNTDSVAKQVILLKSYGSFIGLASKYAFNMSTADSTTYFSTATMTAVSGLTINGDIKFTGQITNKTLSMSVDIDKLGIAEKDVTVSNNFTIQNQSIVTILGKMFPITENSATDDLGIQIGSEARVVCYYTAPTSGTQIRRFRAENDPVRGISWRPYYIYSSDPANAFGNLIP